MKFWFIMERQIIRKLRHEWLLTNINKKKHDWIYVCYVSI